MSKIYLVIYTDEIGLLGGIHQTLNNYDIGNKSIERHAIINIEYQNVNYEINYFITKIQKEILSKKGIYFPNQSKIANQYLEIIRHGSYSKNRKYFVGLPQIIRDSVLKNIQMPIYHTNFLDEEEMNLLRKNSANQFMNRYQMAKFIETKPVVIDESKIDYANESIECFVLKKCKLKKTETKDPKLAWYSIGEIIGEDPWGITALYFTPINFDQYQTDLNKMKYSNIIKEKFLHNVSSNSNILRLYYNTYFEQCSYFIENEDNFIYCGIDRIY